jgi:hypothetical protein
MSRLCMLALLLAACRTEPIPDAQENATPAATTDSSTGGCRTAAACYFKNGLPNTSCLRDATPRTLALLQDAMACIQQHCKTNGQCSEQCALCILNGYTAFTGEPCSNLNSLGCKAPQCSSEINACLAN